MIGPGCMPSYRPRVGLKKRTLAYTPLPRRSRPRINKTGPTDRTSSTEMVLFAHGPAEFPVATVIPREKRARAVVMLAAFQRWLLARWTWLQPRTIPCAVAMLGMLAVIWSADYLAHQYDDQIGAASIALPHGGEAVHVRISAP